LLLSNIPLLFFPYHTKKDTEDGEDWFHRGYEFRQELTFVSDFVNGAIGAMA